MTACINSSFMLQLQSMHSFGEGQEIWDSHAVTAQGGQMLVPTAPLNLMLWQALAEHICDGCASHAMVCAANNASHVRDVGHEISNLAYSHCRFHVPESGCTCLPLPWLQAQNGQAHCRELVTNAMRARHSLLHYHDHCLGDA